MLKPFYQDKQIIEYCGHTPDVLKELSPESVHMVVTSPPYFGLRSYGLEPQIWDEFGIACPDCLGSGHEGGKGREQCPSCNGEGRYRCEHEWGDENIRTVQSQRDNSGGLVDNRIDSRGQQSWTIGSSMTASQGQFCQKCNAWKGDLGNEPSIDLYLSHLVQIFRGVKRVLRPEGTLWLNIAGCYAGAGDRRGGKGDEHGQMKKHKTPDIEIGFKPKDYIDIPAFLSEALRKDGWWLRSKIIWAKPSCMPESVNGWRWERHQIKVKASARAKKDSAHSISQNGVNNPQGARNGVNFADHSDEYQNCPGCPKCEPNGDYILRKGSWRPTSSHEYVFMFAKSEKYFADGEAVRENRSDLTQSVERRKYPVGKMPGAIPMQGTEFGQSGGSEWENDRTGRNLRSVWTIEDDGLANWFKWYANQPEAQMLYDRYAEEMQNKSDVWTITTESLKEAHFAAFPSKLCEIAIKAGSSERGCCPKCFSPWVRMVEKGPLKEHPDRQNRTDRNKADFNGTDYAARDSTLGLVAESNTIGWKPSCECNKDYLYGPEVNGERQGRGYFDSADIAALKEIENIEKCNISPIPCTVLDPFSGSGRALIVSKNLGRKGIGIDLKLDYLKMPLKKLAQERLI